jgi:hypothetical protein
VGWNKRLQIHGGKLCFDGLGMAMFEGSFHYSFMYKNLRTIKTYQREGFGNCLYRGFYLHSYLRVSLSWSSMSKV